MSITERAAIVLQQIDAALALAEKATPGPWGHIIDDTGDQFSGWPSVDGPPEADASIVHRAGFKQEFWGDWTMRQANANAAFIAASRTGWPASLRCLKMAIETLLEIADHDFCSVDVALTTLCDQWEAGR